MTQTDEDFITELRALAEKATGLTNIPWEAYNGDVYFDGERVAKDCWTADADFIAAARTAVPRLLRIIERLEKERDDWRQRHRDGRDAAEEIVNKICDKLKILDDGEDAVVLVARMVDQRHAALAPKKRE